MSILSDGATNNLARRVREMTPFDTRQTVLFWDTVKMILETRDWQKDYKANLQTQPESWEYRHKLVKYTLNKNWFRALDLSSYDWTNSVILFGESNTFGIGLDDLDTLSYQLQGLLNKPVINLASAFYTNNMTSSNVCTVVSDVKPLAVVCVWSPFNRWAYKSHIQPGWVVCQQGMDDYYPLYSPMFESDFATGAVMQGSMQSIATAKQCLSSNSIPAVHCSWFDMTQEVGIDGSTVADIKVLQTVDRSRNLITAGSQSMVNAAQLIANDLLPSLQ